MEDRKLSAYEETLVKLAAIQLRICSARLDSIKNGGPIATSDSFIQDCCALSDDLMEKLCGRKPPN